MPSNPNTLRFTHTPGTSPWSNPLTAKEFDSGRLPGERYSERERIQALAIYAETGNQTLAAKQTGVSRHSVSDWVNDESASSLVDDLRSTIRYECGWDLARAVKRRIRMLDEVMDRGDPHVLKDGRVIYTPPSYKDSVICLSILMDKWMLISGAISQSAAITQGLSKLQATLDGLGSQLAPSPSLGGTPREDPVTGPGGGENLIW